MNHINIIGGGLAGCEAAYQIAKQKIPVKLYEMKPVKFTPAHTNKDLAEIVCSNSFKSNRITNACGLLKEELRYLDSLLIKIADETAVPAGQALAVDREKFAARVTEEIQGNPYIEIINVEIGVTEGHVSEEPERRSRYVSRRERKINFSLQPNEQHHNNCNWPVNFRCISTRNKTNHRQPKPLLL